MKKKQSTQSFQTALVQLPLMVREDEGAPALSTPFAVNEIMADTRDMAQEAFFVITLNTRNKMINRHMITLGLVDQAPVHPREVFRPAILDGATSIIVSHNHPTGDPAPSIEDKTTTKRLKDAGELIGIKLLDHVIIGRGETPFFSLRESGLL